MQAEPPALGHAWNGLRLFVLSLGRCFRVGLLLLARFLGSMRIVVNVILWFVRRPKIAITVVVLICLLVIVLLIVVINLLVVVFTFTMTVYFLPFILIIILMLVFILRLVLVTITSLHCR